MQLEEEKEIGMGRRDSAFWRLRTGHGEAKSASRREPHAGPFLRSWQSVQFPRTALKGTRSGP